MATSKKATTEVATKQVGEIMPFAAAEVPAYLQNNGPARGSEEVGMSDMVLPRLELVQATSPIKEIEGNEDVRDGHLFNSVTGEIYGEHVYFIPVYYRLEFLIWQNADEGGGFHGAFPSEDAARVKYKELIAADPTLNGVSRKNDKPMLEIVDTPVQYGMKITEDGKTEQIVISMPKTKAKVSRRWNSMIQMAGGDRFGRVYKIGSITDENKQGKKFKNFVVQPAGFAPEAAYREGERIYEAFRSGAMQVAHANVIDDEGGEAAPVDGLDRGGI